MPVDVVNAGVPIDELAEASDPRAMRVAAAAALQRRHLPARQRRDLARVEARRAQLVADRRPVELRHYPAPWQRGHKEAIAAGGFRTQHSDVGTLAGGASINRRPALMLYGLVREFAPRRLLEMGTSVGISGAYQAFGLRHAGGGRMIALDGAPDLAAIAAETYGELGLGDVEVRVGPFTQTLADAIREGVDFAFVDGHHDGRATLEYFEQLLPRAERSLLAFDDVRWSDGMRDAWRRIANDERVSFAVNAGRLGIAFTGPPGRRSWRGLGRRRKRPSDLVRA